MEIPTNDGEIEKVLSDALRKRQRQESYRYATTGFLIAGIVVATAALVGVFFHAKQYAFDQAGTVTIYGR